MAVPPVPENLELKVTNFGPIARAAIDLRPMTVFVGPSNTGKSYLAILIYALHKFFSGRIFDSGFEFEQGSHSIFRMSSLLEEDRPLSRGEVDALNSWAVGIWESGETRRVGTLPPELPESVAGLVRERLRGIQGLVEYLDAAMSRCFDIESTTSLVRNEIQEGMSVTINRPIAAAESIKYEYTRRGDFSHLEAIVPDATPLYRANSRTDPESYFYMSRLRAFRSGDAGAVSARERAYVASGLLGILADEYGAANLRSLTDRSYYLPADRTGIMHAHKVVVSSLVARSRRGALGPERPLPPLPEVLADFLQILIDLGDRPRVRSRGRESLARSLEMNVLRGAIRDTRSATGYPEFWYRPDGWEADLPLTRTSSMVSELAPVVLYLRHVVSSGDLLIIEEPESHLHPAMQVEFIRQMAGVVRAGVRVLLTTHSEWVLDELANLVRLSSVPESRREGIAGRDFALDHEQLGVWLFEPKKRPKGSVVKEIPFDEEFGGFRSGFDDIAIDTYNEYATISNRIEETKASYEPR